MYIWYMYRIAFVVGALDHGLVLLDRRTDRAAIERDRRRFSSAAACFFRFFSWLRIYFDVSCCFDVDSENCTSILLSSFSSLRVLYTHMHVFNAWGRDKIVKCSYLRLQWEKIYIILRRRSQRYKKLNDSLILFFAHLFTGGWWKKRKKERVNLPTQSAIIFQCSPARFDFCLHFMHRCFCFKRSNRRRRRFGSLVCCLPTSEGGSKKNHRSFST